MHIFPQANLDRSKLKYLLAIIGVWTAFGLFFGTQNYIRETYAGRPASLPVFIIGWIFCGYSWGILTIPVLCFIRRFSLLRLGWLRFVSIQLPAAVIFSFAQLGIYLCIAGVLFRASSRGLWEFYKFLLANELQSSLLVYAAIVVTVTLYDRFFRHPTIVAADSIVDESTYRNSNGHSAIPTHANGFLRRIAIKDGGRIVLIDVDQIDRVESYGNYLFLHTANRKYIHRETMTSIERKLDPKEFIRIRSSAIVKIDRVKELHPTDNGEFEIVLENGTILSSTRRYKKNLESLIRS